MEGMQELSLTEITIMMLPPIALTSMLYYVAFFALPKWAKEDQE